MLNWLIYAVVGRLLIFLGMRLHLPERIENINWISQLHMCSLCMGVWIFTILAYFMGIDILNSWFGFPHIAILGEIVTGSLTSYVVWIFVAGWNSVHDVVII